MTKIITVANQKGGVGKTTSAVNIAAFCALSGKQTLLVDVDPQGNASSVLAPDYDGPSPFAQQIPLQTSHQGLDILPSGNDLLGQEQRLNQIPGGRDHLKRNLLGTFDQYDVVFIDCPPNLTVLPANALIASDSIIIPIQCEYYAMEGLSQILQFIDLLSETEGHDVGICGIVLTMFNKDVSLSKAVAHEIRNHFGDLVFSQHIPRDISLAAAPSHSHSILNHAPLSEGALAYLSLTNEILKRIDKRRETL